MHATTPPFALLRTRYRTLALAALLALTLIAGTAYLLRYPPLWYTLIGSWRSTTAVSRPDPANLPPYLPVYQFAWDGVVHMYPDFGLGADGRYSVLDNHHIALGQSNTAMPLILTLDLAGDQLVVTYPSGRHDHWERIRDGS